MLRFAPPEGKIHDFIHDQENKNRRGRTEMNVSLLKSFLQWKVELRNVEGMPPALLNELLSEFVLTVRTKDGNYYESTSLRGLILPPLNDISNEKLTSLNHQRSRIIAFEKTRRFVNPRLSYFLASVYTSYFQVSFFFLKHLIIFVSLLIGKTLRRQISEEANKIGK